MRCLTDCLTAIFGGALTIHKVRDNGLLSWDSFFFYRSCVTKGRYNHNKLGFSGGCLIFDLKAGIKEL